MKRRPYNPDGGAAREDLAIALENRPGSLADMSDALGRAGVIIEGGGAWVVNGQGVAHFLFKDFEPSSFAYENHGTLQDFCF